MTARPVLTYHASEQAVKRSISVVEIFEALAAPGKVIPARDECTNVYGLASSGRRIRIKLSPAGLKIVTVANAGWK